MAPHLVLLGDSIFDNGAYTSGEPDVVTHLRTLLPSSWRATLLAEDGATVSRLDQQVRRVPAGASHLFVSIGGNDALQNADLLSLPVRSSGEALIAFAQRLARFEAAYRGALSTVIGLGHRTAVCTIYNGWLEEPRATAARMGVALFNDVILRAAVDRRVDAIELRSICTDAADYANPIEPSGRGGLKIARSIATLAGALGTDRRSAGVWASG